MAIEAIRLQNFMAFEDTGWIELKPISLLFGRNSSGKSAIIKSLLLLRQSLNALSGEGPLIFLDPHGHDFGDFGTILHQANENQSSTGRDITFCFACRLNEEFGDNLQTIIKKQKEDLDYKYKEDNTRNLYHLCLSFGYENDEEVNDDKEVSYKNGKAILSGLRIKCPWLLSPGGNEQIIFEAIYLDKETSLELDEDWYFTTDIFGESSFDIEQNIWNSSTVEIVSGFLPVLRHKTTSSISGELKDDITFVINLLSKITEDIKKFLESIIHIGPLRPEPKRIYGLNTVESKIWEQQGWGAFLKFLRDEIDQQQTEEIDNWLTYLKLGEKIQLKESKKIGSAILSQVSILELKNNKGFNFKDMGFGASQTLPIIVQCVLAEPGSFIIIEQPELHLHPKLQATLSDLFISSTNNNIRFLIETHSENLLLRLRRRLAQTSGEVEEAQDYQLKEKDFKAYFIDRKEGLSFSEELKFDEWGEFTKKPIGFGDFFGQDFEELVKMKKAKSM